MARLFNPKEYVPDYEKASDLEHIQGKYVHPKVTGLADGHAKDEIIIVIAGKVSRNGGSRYGAGGVFFGPGSDLNRPILHLYDDANAQDARMKAFNLKHWQSSPPMFQDTPTINGTPAELLKKVIFKSESDFLAEVMTVEGLAAIKDRGGKTSYGEVIDDIVAVLREA
ncbi:Uu.00g128620.m01.CDS01 [Anthostomella pinea]|uniref:Uu.00g128620.m01.CDS01 n=1 Tax=Anthostomella pinea TaxID=933095 RepID=A0AAI8VI99_9PEZI|nr:Uu.00g128620.m01.CDS01 [Anthostomella pinea]